MMKATKTKKLITPEEEGPLQNPEADRKLIVLACAEGDAPCHKIFDDYDNSVHVCRAYIDPAAVQNRMGKTNACPIRGAGMDFDGVQQGKERFGQGKTKAGGNR